MLTCFEGLIYVEFEWFTSLSIPNKHASHLSPHDAFWIRRGKEILRKKYIFSLGQALRGTRKSYGSWRPVSHRSVWPTKDLSCRLAWAYIWHENYSVRCRGLPVIFSTFFFVNAVTFDKKKNDFIFEKNKRMGSGRPARWALLTACCLLAPSPHPPCR